MSCNHLYGFAGGKVHEITGQFDVKPGYVVLGIEARCAGCTAQFTAAAEIERVPFIGMMQVDVEEWSKAFMAHLLVWFVKTQAGPDPLVPDRRRHG